MSMQVTPLKVDDEDFLVASLIDRCPKVMMLRELVQNALEASALAPEGARKVHIFAANIDGARKLGIWNSGPGMTRDELYRMGDLSSSINRIKSLNQNFGMGAKVASLASNTLGVRYRSCRNGLVHEVLLGKRAGSYGRIWRTVSLRTGNIVTDQYTDIADVSVQAAAEGRDLSADWTEVVLYGNRAEQDTTQDPYDGDPSMDAFWIPQTLYHRYFRLPPGIEVLLDPALHWGEGTRRFETLTGRLSVFARHEAVQADEGVVIHFFYDPPHKLRSWENQSSEGALQISSSSSGFVYQNEIFDMRFGSPWAYVAPSYGIPFKARHFSVYIELSADYPVVPDTYRQFVRYRIGDQRQVFSADFAHLARQAQPAWLRTQLELLGAEGHVSTDVRTELSALATSLDLRLGGDDAGTTVIPDIVLLHDEQDIRDRWLDGRAACFYPETLQVFINTRYPSVAALQLQLEAEFADSSLLSDLSSAAKEVAQSSLVRRIGRAVLYGLAKRADPQHWGEGHIEKAISPESLSLVADDIADVLPWARAALQRYM